MSPVSPRLSVLRRWRNRRRLSIRWVFVVPFVIQVTAAVSLTGWLSLRHGQQAVSDLSEQLRQEIALLIEHHLVNYLEQPHLINQLNANAIRNGWLDPSDPDALSRHFGSQLKLFDVAHIYFGNPQGGFAGAGPRADGTLSLTQTPDFRRGKFQVFAADEAGLPGKILREGDADYDARRRPWYRAAQATEVPTWGQVSPSFNNAELNLSPSLSVYAEDGQFLGVLGVDLQLFRISEFLRQLYISQNSQVYVVEASGQLIAASGREQVILNEAGKETWLRASDSTEPLIRATDRFLRHRYDRYRAIASSQQLEFQHAGERIFVQVTPLRDARGLEWWIAIAIPESDFSAEIQKNRRTTIWLCLGALAIAILVGGITSQLLVQPLSTLRQATRDISNGAFGRRVPRFAFSELADLAAAFNRMAEQLQLTFRDLAQRQAKLAEAQQIAHVGSWEFMVAEQYLSGSDEWWRIAGWALPPPALGLRAALRHIPRGDRDRLWRRVRASIAQQQAFDLEVGWRQPDGQPRQIYILGRLKFDRRGRLARLYGTVMDVTEQRQAAAALRAAEAKYRSIFENAIEGIFCVTPAGTYLSVNPALAKLYGYVSPAEFMQRRRHSASQYVEPQRHREWLAALQARDRVTDFESQVYRADGSTVWVSESARAVCDADGHLLHYEGSVVDITQRRQVEAQLRYSAYYDPLTHLPNRKAFFEHLQAAIARNQAAPAARFAVLFLDLDRFKLVNDSLGHVVGDRLLVLVATSLQACLGLTPITRRQPLVAAIQDPDRRLTPTVARFGGDEFIILLPQIENVQAATAVAEQILQTLRAPFDLAGNAIFVNASVGIALNQKGWRPETFLRNADIALYQAKACGGNNYEVFDNQMHAQAVGRLQLENDLRHCLANEELTIHYQPIVSVATRRIIGFEALVRWQHPFEGFISPAKFIPVAEETGLIVPLGQWVLEQACQQMQVWLRHFPHSQALSMGVNLSGRQFAQPDLLERIAGVLEMTRLPPQNLRLELTESTLMDKAQVSNAILRRLSDLGIRLSVDDFGTGYSSLSYLYRFPLHTLKIDRSFVRRLDEHDESLEIVAAIVTLAHSLGMNIVAEGVETEQQFQCLQSLGCEHVQGYLFAPPLPVEQATRLLAESPAFAEVL